jgi:hypothetical protein
MSGYHKQKWFSDQGFSITKSATNGGHGYCDGASFSESTLHMTAVIDNNAGNNVGDDHGYHTNDTVRNCRDFPHGDHTIHCDSGIHDHHSVPHQPRRCCMAARGSWPRRKPAPARILYACS